MPRGIRCTNCGKSIELPSAGDKVLCSACGAWIEIGSDQDAWVARLRERAAEVLEGRRTQALTPPPVVELSYSPVDQEQPTATATLPEMPASGSRWSVLWVILILLCVFGMGAVATVYFVLHRDGWEQANRAGILAIKKEAEVRALSGDLAGAHERYQQLQEMVAGQQIRDSALREQVDAARVAQEKVFLMLLEQKRRPPAPATLPAAAVVPAPVVEPSPPVAAVPQPVVVARVEQPKLAPAPPPPPARPRRPEPRPKAIPAGGVTDEQIGQAIRRGAECLLSYFEDGELRVGGRTGAYRSGENALCVYALLQCGQAISDERLNIRGKAMKTMVDKMRNMSITGGPETYARGIRATALALYNRQEDRETLKEDLAWLLKAANHGAYTYDQRAARGVWDNSNAQYGLLGVWSAAEAGMEVPKTYWLQVQNHWFECQLESGEWGYGRALNGDGRISMTCAGLASVFVTHDYLDAAQFGTAVGRAPFSKPLERGLAWLERGDNCLTVLRGGFSRGYNLYGLERVGLASGFKYLGQHDWYRTLAGMVIERQRHDGSFGDFVETSYALLFLARGRHPILMNKLRFEGSWANRPRDLSNLSRFAWRELERPLNWQVVPIERDWTEWMDSPILYIASHQPVRLGEAELTKLRKYVEAGGMLFTHADGDSASFNQFATELGRKLFPQYEWQDLPQNHELYSLNFKVEARPKLRHISNGSRILMLHSPEDIARHWQLRAEKTRTGAFNFGLNLFLYGAGKADLRNRLSSPYLPPPRGESVARMRLARVKFAGTWDPEPAAMERFSRWFEYQTGYALDVAAVDPAELRSDVFPVAHLTGTGSLSLPGPQAEAIRKYVEDGGVLLIDACGGSFSFNQGVNRLLSAIAPNSTVTMLDREHPLLAGKAAGMDPLPRPVLRPLAEQKLGRSAVPIELRAVGKGYVIYSPIDLMSSLLGTNTWSILGFGSGYAQSFVKNVILWTVDGR